jgi:ABC-2 type transport system permease protein
MNRFKKYFRIINISFKNGVAYRIDYVAGIANIIFAIVVNVILWQTLYKGQNLENSIQHKMMITYIILSIIFQTVFIMDEFIIENKMRDGSIIHYFIKPMSFRFYVFANTLGKTIFNILMILLPAVIIIKLLYGILLPYSLSYFLYFILAIVLGYMVLYNLNFIFWTFSLEFMTSWGLITLKNALIVVLSGALIPLWLMPDNIAKIVQYLPFQSIYYFPLTIYLGIIPEDQIFKGIIIQLAWIILFIAVGHFAWRKSVKGIVVQGG